MPGNNSVGRELMDLVTSVPRMSHEDFETILNSNMQVSGTKFIWDNHFHHHGEHHLQSAV